MILVLDNYDSFTYNLVQYLQVCGAEVTVYRNDAITLEGVLGMGADAVLLSPGPSTPRESGVCLDVGKSALDGQLQVPLLGVCLGHQVLGHLVGATVEPAARTMHGKSSPISHDGKGIFRGIPSPFNVIRYHSLVIVEPTLQDPLVVTARSDDDGEVMGIRHKELPIEGVQFHPESILTEHGMDLMANWLGMVEQFRSTSQPSG